MKNYLNLFLLILALSPVAKADLPTSSSADLSTKVGQFFLFGISDNTEKLSKDSVAHLSATKPGGYILFRRNMKNNHQLASLVKELQKLSKSNSDQQAFIALDQEGGQVTRIPLFPQMPSPWAVAKTQDPVLAKEFGASVGNSLREFGFNMNLAPVLDVGARNQYSFLGARAYTQDVNNISKMGVAFAEGLLSSKVIPVGKHFPGLGPVVNDPHKVLVRRTVSYESLLKKDLPPFQAFSKLETSAMMVSHFIYPKLDSNLVPATFSKPIINGILRGTLGYQGLVMTDDLMMEGAKASKSFQENVLQAFEAGADLIMVSWSRERQKLAVDGLIAAVNSGRIKISEIDERLERMKRIKSTLPVDENLSSENQNQLLATTTESYKGLVRKITELNIEKELKTLEAAKASRYCLLPDQKSFGQGVYNGLKKTVPLSLATVEAEDFSDFCDENGRLLIFVRNQQEYDLAKSMPENIKSRTLLINQIRPSLFKEKFPLEIQIFTNNVDIPELLSRNLRPNVKASPVLVAPQNLTSKDGPQDPIPLSTEQSQVESASTPRHPASGR